MENTIFRKSMETCISAMALFSGKKNGSTFSRIRADPNPMVAWIMAEMNVEVARIR